MSDPIVILGMHRSGTSFLVRSLNLSGLWLGGDSGLSTVEGRAMIGNPKGNYEHRGAISINDAILRRSGGAWVKPPSHLVTTESDQAEMRRFCTSLEDAKPPEFTRWGWKDPRTVLTLDIWQRALTRPLFLVASFRHPSAVAHSLLSRDRIPLEIGYGLWTYYNTRLLAHLDLFPHRLVRFDTTQDELIAQTVRVCEVTGLKSLRPVLEGWHDPQLVRSKPASDSILDVPQVGTVWAQLLERHRSQPAV